MQTAARSCCKSAYDCNGTKVSAWTYLNTTLQQRFDAEFQKLETADHAYPPIVARRKKQLASFITHENNKLLNDGDLLLIDAGCEIH